KSGVQKSASSATPADNSPSGTSLANVATNGTAIRCRYQLLIEPGAAECDQSLKVAARIDGLANQLILPIPSKTKNTPMQTRSTVHPSRCRSIAMCRTLHLRK